MSSCHLPMLLTPLKLFSSVGTCGTNNSSDVKQLQQLISDAGYQLATGRHVGFNGQCSQETIEAIKWYQQLLNMFPTGLVHPLDSSFMTAQIDSGPHWRPRHTQGSLKVREGQLTFDAEGVDYVTAVEPFRQTSTLYFSRILQWPGGASGVTLGRGYDMGQRSRGEIHATLCQAGIEDFKASLCSRAAGLRGHFANEYVYVYRLLVGEITHLQQIALFEIIYPDYIRLSQHYYNKYTRTIINKTPWTMLKSKIKDVYVDVVYQGVDDIKLLVLAVEKNQSAILAKEIRRSSLYMHYEESRNRLNYLL